MDSTKVEFDPNETKKTITGVSKLGKLTSQKQPALINILHHAAQTGATSTNGADLGGNQTHCFKQAIAKGYKIDSKILLNYSGLALVAQSKAVTVPAALTTPPSASSRFFTGLPSAILFSHSLAIPAAFSKAWTLGLGSIKVNGFFTGRASGLCLPFWLVPPLTIKQKRGQLRNIFSHLARNVEKHRKALSAIPRLPEKEGYAVLQRLAEAMLASTRKARKDIARSVICFGPKNTDDLIVQQLLGLMSIASVRANSNLQRSLEFVQKYHATTSGSVPFSSSLRTDLIRESSRLLQALGDYVYALSGAQAVVYPGPAHLYLNSTPGDFSTI
jgi:hypothetical protein